MRIIRGHPEMEVTVTTAHQYAGERVASLYPSLEGFYDGTFAEFDAEVVHENCDAVFLGLPHGESMAVAPGLLDAGKKVVDLSADFRLRDPASYENWYGTEHACPGLLGEAVYGLPEVNREKISGARLVANPGCYPTCALLGLFPLAGAGMIGGPVVIDAKSGISGAGRKLTLATHYTQAAENICPYGVSGHRHLPEITAELSRLAGGAEVPIVFTPHLAPMNRGILCTIYVPLAGTDTGITRSPGDLARDIRGLYERAYRDEQFVSLLPDGEYPQTKAVHGSNNCHVGLELAAGGSILIVMAAIDNLVKGASGQAVQSMNAMCGIPESLGLVGPGYFP
jgi:N-acetyl-gamma-glutamyl-phosphate reductase